MSQATAELDRRQMFAEIKKLCAPDNTTNWLVIIREYIVFAAFVAGCLLCYRWISGNGWSLWWMAPVYLLTVMAIGVWVQNRLAVLIHESSHYSLFRNRVLNDVMANLFLAFPFFGAVSNYRIGHWGHHRHVNDPEKDPDLLRLAKHHPRDLPLPKWRFVIEYVGKQLLIHNAVSYLRGRASYVAVTMKAEAVRNHDPLGKGVVWSMRLGYVVVLFGMLTYFGWWPHYLALWIVPFLTFYPATLFLREIAHHGNYPDSGDFTNSRVYLGKWLEREIFFPFSEQNHVLHHIFPTIPYHKMDQAHEVMMRYPPYRDSVVICNGFFIKADSRSDLPTVLDVLSAPPDRYLRNRQHAPEADQIRHSTVDEVGGVATAAERAVVS